MRYFLVASLILIAGQASAAAPPWSVRRLIEQLGSGEFRKREEATKALEAAGELALPAVARAATSSDLEVRRRCHAILKRQQTLLLAAVTSLEGYWEKDPDTDALLVKLTGKHVLDDDLARVKWLSGLTRLYVRHTRVTDNGLAHVKEQTALRRFSLFGTPVSDGGLLHLKGLVNLEHLDLDNTRVGDAGLAHLKGLRELRHLCLSGTRVTDAGLAHLHGLEKLQRISLANTRVTPKGIEELQKALPWLVIERYSASPGQK